MTLYFKDGKCAGIFSEVQVTLTCRQYWEYCMTLFPERKIPTGAIPMKKISNFSNRGS